MEVMKNAAMTVNCVLGSVYFCNDTFMGHACKNKWLLSLHVNLCYNWKCFVGDCTVIVNTVICGILLVIAVADDVICNCVLCNMYAAVVQRQLAV